MVTFLPGAAVVALSRHRSTWRRLTAAAITVLMVATIILTRSRGGALGLGVAIVALVILGRRVRPGFAVIAIVTLMASAPLLPGSFWTRMSTIVDAEEDAKQFTGSRAARSAVMREGINTFLDRPLAGVGVGQFKNYNPPGREHPWLETHNAMIQVAAETGLPGLLLFLYLIYRAGAAAVAARRMLDDRRANTAESRAVLTPPDRRALYENTVGLSAGLAGWFTCALFASVAYNWTFYYLLALIVATRELVKERQRLSERSAEVPAARTSRFISAARVFPERSTGLA
jgi:O-antigen ligase